MTSAQPLKEAFTQPENLKRVLMSLFGATAGQGVVWYTGQFYALFYLQTILKVHPTSANYIVAAALLLGMPLFVVFGALSRSHRPQEDHDGRLPDCRRVVSADLSRDAGCGRFERRHGRSRSATPSPARSG